MLRVKRKQKNKKCDLWKTYDQNEDSSLGFRNAFLLPTSPKVRQWCNLVLLQRTLHVMKHSTSLMETSQSSRSDHWVPRDLMSVHLWPKLLSASFTLLQPHSLLPAKTTKHIPWLKPLAVCSFLLEVSSLRLSMRLPSSSAPRLHSNTFSRSPFWLVFFKLQALPCNALEPLYSALFTF